MLQRRPQARALVVGMLVTLALHFTWEMLQAPAFMEFAGSTWEGTVRCFVASLGDVLLASGAFAVTALVFRRPNWPLLSRWAVPAITWMAIGLVATIALERWSLDRGRWVYGSEMPLVFGIGLLPLVQWLAVPAITLVIVRYLARNWAAIAETRS